VQSLAAILGYSFHSSSWLTNVDGMKDLWRFGSNLAAINTDMNGVKDLRTCYSLAAINTECKAPPTLG
jgi:hypothetical protein